MITAEHRFRIAKEKIDCFPAAEAVISPAQMQRYLIMRQRDQRFDAIFQTFIDHLVIECQSGFVGFRFIPARINPAPRDGETKYLEAHFRHQRDIFPITVIKIRADQFQIIRSWLVSDRSAHALRHDVLLGQTLAVLKISTLALVGCQRAAP